MTVADTVISFEKVGKAYGPQQVLTDINLDIRAGEVVVICGPSGSGKSTLLRCINGLESVQQGQIRVNDRPVAKSGGPLRALRSDIGFVFQSFNLYPHLSVLQNLVLAPMLVRRLNRHDATANALSLLARVGLADKAHAYPAQLSGGQQQRVAIARTLAMAPQIILFDEPTSALDPEMIGEVLDVISGLAQDGITLVIVTHEMGFARHVANRIVFMSDGCIVEEASAAQFFERPAHPRARQFLGKVLNPYSVAIRQVLSTESLT